MGRRSKIQTPKNEPATISENVSGSTEIVNAAKEKPIVNKTESKETGAKTSPDVVSQKQPGNNLKAAVKKKKSLLDRFIAAVKSLRVELLIALIGLTLSLGQYFQSNISVRINVTNTWRDGYTSDIRNRVTKFRTLYNDKWIPGCKDDGACINKVNDSVEKIVDGKRLYNENLLDDLFITELISDEIPENLAIRTTPPNPENDKKLAQAYVQILLKYRNSIIEALNTMEAVKAVMDAKPLYKWHIFYSDTLESRYRETIKELRRDLNIFIQTYRRIYSRPTAAWLVLTEDPTFSADHLPTIIFAVLTILALLVIYELKKRNRLLEKFQTA